MNFEHRRLRVFTSVEVLLMNQLILERTEEALDHRIVVAVALPPPTCDEHGLTDKPLIRSTGVRGPLVTVMDEPRSWASVRERHL